jgi:hypothetical protein
MSTAKMFVPASLMMVLATAVLGVQTSFAEPAADDCKTTPGSSAPPGQHWYYRINRSDQRHCWYLGAEGTKVRAQTREKASSSPAHIAREEASETTRTMPPPLEVIQTPSVPAASSEGPAAAELARPSLDLPQAPDPTAREPAITSHASAAAAQSAPDAQEEMPLVWPVLTDAERAGSPDSARGSAPWSVFVVAGVALLVAGALLIAGSLFKLAWRARSQLRRHPPLRQPRPRQQRRTHAAHPAVPSRSSRPQIRVANAPRRQASPAGDVNRSAAGGKSAGARA